MNIIVKPYEGTACYCRPDTTWERENKDFYVPDTVDRLLWAPVLFARISKAGKHIGTKFVSRYYDAVGFGALMYSGDEGIAFSSCLDHTSILPAPLYNPVVLENSDNVFEATCNGTSVARCTVSDFKDIIEKTICSVSQRVSLRIGDMVAVELSCLQGLADRSEGEVRFGGCYCGNNLFDLKIIF
jgi:hypothetical protein